MWYNDVTMEQDDFDKLKAELEKANQIIAEFNSEKVRLARLQEELTYREANLRRKYDEAGLNYE